MTVGELKRRIGGSEVLAWAAYFKICNEITNTDRKLDTEWRPVEELDDFLDGVNARANG